MPVAFCGDIHLDTLTHAGLEIAYQSIIRNTKDCKTLILLGDVHDGRPGEQAQKLLEMLADRFDNVYMVPGNHDFYFHYIHELPAIAAFYRVLGVTLLYNQIVYIPELGKTLFSTLWAGIGNNPVLDYLTSLKIMDFQNIHGYCVEDTVRLHKDCVDFIEANIDTVDCIVTHFSPCGLSQSEVHREANKPEIDQYYFTELLQNQKLISDKPILWVHGHLHNPAEYDVDNFHVVGVAKSTIKLLP